MADPQTTTPAPSFDLNAFTSALGGTRLADSRVQQLTQQARRAMNGNTTAYKTLTGSISGAANLTPAQKASLSTMLGTLSPSSGGSTTTGGGTVTGGGSSGPLQGVQQWATNVLGGNFQNLPMYQELTDPKYADPTQNPYIQSMVGGLQDTLRQDWLGNQAALNEQAEAGGRYGSGAYLAGSRNAAQAADTSLANAIAQMYSGAYENERQRRAGLAGQFLGAQQAAAQIPVSIYGINKDFEAAKAGVNVQRQGVNLQRQEFNFNKQMQLQAAQQDALNDYFNLIAGIGGLGNTSYGQSSGTSASYIPPSNAAATAAVGGLVNAYNNGWQ